MSDYEEFRLRIRGPEDGRYFVEASGPGAAKGEGEFVLPFSEDQLELFILKLGRSRGGKRKIESPENEAARTFGASLFGAVMAGPVGEAYRASLLTQPELRVTVSLGAAPSLMTVPWEFMFDTSDFIATSPDTPVVRTLDVAQPPLPLKVELPLRILVVSCQPTDTEAINAGLERANLEPALKPLADRNAVVVDWLEHATLSALNEKLYSGEYHVLHFIGHGGFVKGMGEGALVFEDDHGMTDVVGADRFAAIVRARSSIRLVVLNSCEGARGSVDDPFSGVAASLIERRLPAVIGMQFEISDAAAIRFAKYFYAVLAEGQPVDRAVTEARLAMFAGREDVEWGTPVLFMRAADGHLFAIPNAVPIPRDILKEPEPVPVLPQPGIDPTIGPDPEPKPNTEPEPTAKIEPEPPPKIEPEPPPEIEPEIDPPPSVLDRLRLAFGGLSRRTKVGIGGVAGAVFIAAIAFVLLGSASAAIRVTTGDQPGRIVVSGERFRASENVVVTFGSQSVKKLTGSDGSFSVTMDVGEGAAGIVLAEGEASRLRATAQLQLPHASGTSSAAPSSAGSTSPSPTPGGSVAASPTATASAASASLFCFDPALRANLMVFYSDWPSGHYDLKCLDPASGRIGTIQVDGDRGKAEQFISWSPGHDQIVWTQGAAGERDILTMDDNLVARPVSVTNDDDWFPVWSPGNDIAFIRSASKENTTVMRREDGQKVAEPWFSARQIRALAWSPKDPYLAFFGLQAGQTDYDIGIIQSDAQQPSWVIENDGHDMNPTFSTDGQTIAFVRGTPGQSSSNDIWLFDLRTKEQRQLTGLDIDKDGPENDGIGVQDGNPVWSPDGSQISFHRTSGSGYQIWVMNADGSDPHNLMPTRKGNNLDANWR